MSDLMLTILLALAVAALLFAGLCLSLYWSDDGEFDDDE